ncbi:MAG: ABC transporter substrate-binding protein [Thermoflexus sp.]|uniref:ABC transporter substrate-binding protein n=1 Tax=Thermoflexus sp. TaxID=1969742 RepID=UPI0025FA7206|nr:ABC transporter substrate-binding protein [Thermoflexus sp.]MCS6965091.1 ABC transporter substrate-binding protein [Thermoflexus sp.]MDW8186130.1 ABC transporter substrate-binding protein [Anaerolineae bacterium]
MIKRGGVAITIVGLLATLALAMGCGPQATPAAPAPAGEIPIGAIMDTTGPTSDVGKDYAAGIQDAIRWINDQGGVNGKRIRLILNDYGYRVPEAVTLYKRYRDIDKVVAVLGWGTGDTSALAPTVAKDQIPYISASYSGELTDPSKTPYNFFAASDYSTNARAALLAWYEEIWLKDDRFKAEREAGKKPRIVMFYSFPTPYSSAPIKALKEFAQLLGFEIGPDQDVSLTALDAKSQVLAAKEFNPHVIWHGNTTQSVATAIRDAKALDLQADHLVNNWGFGEELLRLLGPQAEGVIGIAVTAFYGENVPGMDRVKEAAQKYNPALKERTIRTVQAWANVMLLYEALKKADAAGQLNGPGIRAAIESFQNLDIGLGVPPLTYTSDDHRPTSQVRIYIVRNGKFELLKLVDLKEKFADQWPKWKGY